MFVWSSYHAMGHVSTWLLLYCHTDADECKHNEHNCSLDASCRNTIGSFECHCKSGYQGDGVQCSGKQLWRLSEKYHVVSSLLLDSPSVTFHFPLRKCRYSLLIIYKQFRIWYISREKQRNVSMPVRRANSEQAIFASFLTKTSEILINYLYLSLHQTSTNAEMICTTALQTPVVETISGLSNANVPLDTKETESTAQVR